MYTIYALRDPRDLQIHYVGLTENHPVWRLVQHLQDKKDLNREKLVWFAELKIVNARPDVTVLQYAPDMETALLYEQYWIRVGLQSGWPLTNRVGKYTRREPKVLIRIAARQPNKTPKPKVLADSKTPTVREPTPLELEVRQWRVEHPAGTQAEIRKYLHDKGFHVVRGTIHRIWHAAQPTTGDKLGTDTTNSAE
jgi:hypothetical protein